MVVGSVLEELLLVVEVECVAKFAAGGVAVESDDAEDDVGAAAGQVELMAEPGGFDSGVGVGAGEPDRGGVGFVADEGIEADSAGDAHVAGFDRDTVHAGLSTPIVAAVVAVVEHDQNVDGRRG